MKPMQTNLLNILNDRIDRLNRHGRFEEAIVAEKSRELLFPNEEPGQSITSKESPNEK